MAILDNIDNSSYPDPWNRHTPKGYDLNSRVTNKIIKNDGLALKIFSDFCCNGCSCKSENDHKSSE